MSDRRVVQAEFDQIALLSPTGFDHNVFYHRFLLRALPPRIGQVLDVGCGTGQLSRLVASRAEHVTGIDLSANMIAEACRQSARRENVEFHQADVLRWQWAAGFDAIVSVATLHHLPLDIIRSMKTALRPGGTLAILDLRRTETVAERLLLGSVAMPVSMALHLWHTGRLRPEAEVRRVWKDHGLRDTYLSVEEVRRACLPILPGAIIRRHLLWRYSLVWRKP